MATNYYIKSSAGAIELANSTWSVGDKMVPLRADASTNYLVARRWVWECTTGGTSTGTPTWPSSVTQDTTTVSQNSVIWTARKPGYSSGTTINWSFATIFSSYIVPAVVAGDVFYLSSSHSESHTAPLTLVGAASGARFSMLSVTENGSSLPTTLTPGATITVTGTSSLTIGHGLGSYFYGITFQSGSSNLNGSIYGINYLGNLTFDSCNFHLLGTHASSTITLAGRPDAHNVAKNCGFKFSAAGQFIELQNIEIYGGSVLSGGTSPTTIFKLSSASPAQVIVSGFDCSQCASSVNLFASNGVNYSSESSRLFGIKMPASWSGSFNSSALNYSDDETSQVASTGVNYNFRRSTAFGTAREEIVIVKTSGASDGVTPISWKVVSNSTALYTIPFISSNIVKWNDTTGSSMTATVEIIHDSATALKDNEVWLELGYLSDSDAPLISYKDDSSNFLNAGASQTTSDATWTTTGMSNPNKQKLEVTFTPQLKGFIIARVKLTKASKTIYIDPVIMVE